MDNIQEIWKDVVGFEGIYQVSDQGRVRRISKAKQNARKPTSEDGCLKPSLDTWGYPKILLYKHPKACAKRGNDI